MLYFHKHPWLTKAKCETLCSIMDYQKLTLEACKHASQNEHLPLRVVVQVLFFEQLQLRNAIAGSYIAVDTADPACPSRLSMLLDYGTLGPLVPGGDGWNAPLRENQALRMDMDTIKSKVNDLQIECSAIRQVIQRINKPKEALSNWAFNLMSNFGCKFKSQVCDSQSQERTIVFGQSLDGRCIEATS